MKLWRERKQQIVEFSKLCPRLVYSKRYAFLKGYDQKIPKSCLRTSITQVPTSPCFLSVPTENDTKNVPRVLAYLLTPWCRVLLEKLTGLQLVKKFPAFHGTRRFITALTNVRQLSLSQASPIQSIYPHPTSNFISLYILRDASPRNTPPSEIRVVESFCLQRNHPAYECFLKRLFYREGLLGPRPTTKLEDHPLSAVHDCLFNLFAVTLHTFHVYKNEFKNLQYKLCFEIHIYEFQLQVYVTVHREQIVKRERKPTRCNSQMFIINMFRASLCPSSGEQDVCYCTWCAALVLLDVVGSGCGTLRCRVRAL